MMIRPLVFVAPFALAACASPSIDAPSLAPRAAEAIDPRVPIPSVEDNSPVDPALVAQLEAQVALVRAGAPEFDRLAAQAAPLAASAGGEASESWVAAQLALSRLVAQYGVTTNAAANVDELAGQALQNRRWISPANRQAITAAQAAIATTSRAQADTIDRLTAQLAR